MFCVQVEMEGPVRLTQPNPLPYKCRPKLFKTSVYNQHVGGYIQRSIYIFIDHDERGKRQNGFENHNDAKCGLFLLLRFTPHCNCSEVC